jgi:hypothetical protein
MMQDKFGKEASSNEDNITPEFQEALAVYFERLNGEGSSEVVALSARTEVGLGTQVEALLEIPRRLERRSVGADVAWQRFQKRNFSPVAEAQKDSLGRYVSQALDQNESAAVVESGLSKSILEAIKSDATSMEELKGYQLNDYAALARRYDVKDSAFPRMLRWLKGLGKSFAMPSLNPSAGMVFAREEEIRQQGLSEAELAEQIEKTDETETEKE